MTDCKGLIFAAFFQFLSGTQTDFMMSPKEKFLLAALMKQKHKTLIAQQKLNIQKKNNAKLSDKLKQTERKVMNFNNFKNDDKTLNFLTGISNVQVFKWLLCLIKPNFELATKSITYENHLLIVLMKLRHGYINKDLALRFNTNVTNISNIFRTYLKALSDILKNFIVWPEREALRRNLPSSFKNFKNCVCIIDCTEVFIERPFNLNARAQTFSNYKSRNTIKYLVGITPSGAVSFLSAGWGGRASDKEITLNSGFLDKVTFGDCVLADRGFLIEEELATRGAVLRIPAFTRGKKQLSAKDVDRSRQIAHVRIHVERVIGQLKKFRILNSVIPISQVDLTDNIMIVISAIVNLSPSVVNQ